MTNSNVSTSIVQIEGEELRQLVIEVKETLATNLQLDVNSSLPKRFTAVDLWKCQNRMRTASSLRRL